MLLTCAVASLLLAGCASRTSVTENQCLAGDWETIGYSDGLSGHQSTRLLQHQDACGRVEVVPDRALYLQGWQEGNAQYCTPANGFSAGERGTEISRACTGYADFSEAYTDGRRLYLAREEERRIRSKINRQEQRLEKLKEAMTDAATAQLDPELTAKERLDLVADLQDYADERSRIKVELPQLYRDLESAERHTRQIAVVTPGFQ